MWFRSSKSLVLAVILIGIGFVQLMMGLSYMQVSKREASTVGTVTRVDCGRSCTYAYTFEVNEVRIRDDSSTCDTALTRAGCKVGAPVLVYYDPQNLSETMPEEFGAASRERYFMGGWMAGCGLLLIGLNFILKKTLKDSEEPEERDKSGPDDESEVLSIAPRD
jgi:hypothetical protein